MTTWLPDPSHYPQQMTPLSATVWFEAMGRGLHEAARELRAPFGGFATRTELGWAYEAELAPDWEPETERLREAALTLPARWNDELLPRVQAITSELERMRPEVPTPEASQAMLDRLWQLVQEQWVLHFLTVIPAQVAAELLRDRYVELFGDDDVLAPYRLLEGIANPADESLRALASLARELEVAEVIIEYSGAQALRRLREFAAGRQWIHALDSYLLRFGGRTRWHELSLPRECEEPTLTMESVRLALQSDAQPHAAQPPVPPTELLALVTNVRAAYALKELHTHEIDYPGLLATREALRGFGRRLLAEGAFRDADDVWMLQRNELRSALTGPLQSLEEIVTARRDELTEGVRQGLAPFLGDPPTESVRHAALEKFYGRTGTGLSGTGASPGTAEGIARVVTIERDFERIHPGDVLVTTTTTPAWTPLFPSLSALVTETGGILSHAAVIAREYGLPAVVGVPDATNAISDGARVRVDGTQGTVITL